MQKYTSSDAWKLIKSDKDVPVPFLKQQIRFQTPCAVRVYGHKSLRERYEIPSNIVHKFLVGKISRRFVKVFQILQLKTFRLKLFVPKNVFAQLHDVSWEKSDRTCFNQCRYRSRKIDHECFESLRMPYIILSSTKSLLGASHQGCSFDG